MALAGPEHAEPRVASTFHTPIWLVAAFGICLYWATMYLDRNGGGFSPLVFSQGEMLADLEVRVPRSEADALISRGRIASPDSRWGTGACASKEAIPGFQ